MARGGREGQAGREMWSRVTWATAAALVALALIGALSGALRSDAATATGAIGGVPASGDWTQYRYDLAGTGANPYAGISTANIGRLALRWQFGPLGEFASTPAIVGNVVYAINNKSLYAFDLTTGKALWHFDNLPNAYGAVLSSSVAVDPAAHMAYYGTPDARVYAVDTRDGHGVWNVQLGDPAHGAFIWSSPLLANGKLYIGLASHEDNPCIRGAAFALDPATGATIWRRDMVPAGELGGGVWSSLTAIPTAGQVIVTTANPCEGTKVPALEDAIVALDWNTGTPIWQYQALHNDSCDCDFGQGAVSYLLDGRQYVVAGNKYGVVYGVAPPASAGSAPRLVWSTRISGAGYLGTAGVYQPPTYSDGRVFVAGGPTLDGACRAALWALDARSGSPLWRVCTSGQVVAASAISHDVLFVAETGVLKGYDVATGRVVWSAPLGGPQWGGVAIVGNAVVVGSVQGMLRVYALPASA